jgi:hypothetical protein
MVSAATSQYHVPYHLYPFCTTLSCTQNLAEPDLQVNLPPAGTKPPSDQQLSEDVGILITGCQSHETSADACPSGNPDKAHGALSNAIQTVVKTHHQQNPGEPLTYRWARSGREEGREAGVRLTPGDSHWLLSCCPRRAAALKHRPQACRGWPCLI